MKSFCLSLDLFITDLPKTTVHIAVDCFTLFRAQKEQKLHEFL